jgi:hypothetical protein
MGRRQSPIFVRTYDFLLWLIPRLLDFPRSQRGVMARQLRIQAFALYESLVDAAVCPAGGDPLPELRRADAELTKLRTYIRLSYEMELFSPSQYEHAARMLAEIGRLLGGWIKKVTDDT